MSQSQITLQVLTSLVKKYGSNLGASVDHLSEAAIYCINPENLVVSDNAIDLMTLLVPLIATKPQPLNEAIDKSSVLCSVDQFKTVEKICELFSQISTHAKTLNYPEIITKLENKVTGIKQILPAKCIAHILMNQTELLNKYLRIYDAHLNENDHKLKSAIIIGEIGKKKDLSSVKNLVERLDHMFLDENADLRSAASHCLGNISIGNVEFFFPKVMGLIQSDAEHKYLLLTSVKDIIRASRGHQFKYLKELDQILFENAKSEEESV